MADSPTNFESCNSNQNYGIEEENKMINKNNAEEDERENSNIIKPIIGKGNGTSEFYLFLILTVFFR